MGIKKNYLISNIWTLWTKFSHQGKISSILSDEFLSDKVSSDSVSRLSRYSSAPNRGPLTFIIVP